MQDADTAPLISCLTVTRDGREAELERCIQCFHSQSYENKELVIVHDGDDATHAHVERTAGKYPQDSFVIERVAEKRPLGELRNVSLEAANGLLACQWDDDDMSHPARLDRQFRHLLDQEADFCFFTDQLHWFQRHNQLYWEDWNVERYPMNLIQGTIMGVREKFSRYQSLEKGEDTALVLDIVNRGHYVAALEGMGYLYVYVYNGRNAWGFSHHLAISSWKRLRHDALAARMDLLRARLPEYDWPVDVLRLPHDSGTLEIELT